MTRFSKHRSLSTPAAISVSYARHGQSGIYLANRVSIRILQRVWNARAQGLRRLRHSSRVRTQDATRYAIGLTKSSDYLYEYKNGDYGWGNSIDRIPLPDREIYTLYDYRKRHATYKTDLDLLLSHQQFPWISVWDDHGMSCDDKRPDNS